MRKDERMIAPLVKRSRPSYSGLGSSVYAYEFDEKHFADGMKRLGRDVLKGEVGVEQKIGDLRISAGLSAPWSIDTDGDSVKVRIGMKGAGVEVAFPKPESGPSTPEFFPTSIDDLVPKQT